MSDVSDAQALAATNGDADKAAKTTTGGLLARSVEDSSNRAVASVVSFTSTTPKQLSTAGDVMLYVNITTAASLAISMGPEVAGTSVALNAAQSDALGLVTIRVPRNWYVVLTGTMGNVICTQVTL